MLLQADGRIAFATTVYKPYEEEGVTARSIVGRYVWEFVGGDQVVIDLVKDSIARCLQFKEVVIRELSPTHKVAGKSHARSWRIEYHPTNLLGAEVCCLVRQISPHIARLTPTQLRILALIGAGALQKEIAKELGIKPSTVANHVANIKARMHCASVADLKLAAIRAGLSG